MAAVINTNYLSLVAQNNLNKSQSALGSAIERLSSGLRINSAKDDAAGQAIANRFTANVRGLTQAARNANDGISIAQTTEGALNEINNNLQRIRELSVQATNGTNSQSDLDSIQAEIQQRLDEIDRVSAQTQFNGVKVLAQDNTLTIQVGANDNETIEIDLKKITAADLGLGNRFNINGPQGSVTAVATADLNNIFGATSGVTDPANISVAASSTTIASSLNISGGAAVTTDAIYKDSKGNLFAKVEVTVADATDALALKAQGFDVESGDTATLYVALKAGEADTTTSPGDAAFTIADSALQANNLLSAGSANPLAAIDAALSEVDSLRSDLGAIQNRFESTIANLNNTVNNLSAARSRIEDADYATEVSNMTKNQILQQAGTSVLAQANQVPQTVLSLLR